MSAKTTDERPSRAAGARIDVRATGATLLDRLRPAVRGRRARTSTKRRWPARRRRRRRCAWPKRRRAPSRRATPTRWSSAPTRSPTATARADRQAGRPRRRPSRNCAMLSGPHHRLPHRRRAARRGERPLPARARRRHQHVSRAVADARSTPTCDREQPYDCAGSRASPRRSASRCSSASTSDDPTALIGLPLIALVDAAARGRRRRARSCGAARMSRAATLYLVPNLLGVGRPGSACCPREPSTIAARLAHWVVETPKAARAFLKTLDMPRADRRAGSSTRIARRHSPRPICDALLAPRATAHDVGLLSDAGCPGVADPGAALVAAAHRAGIASCRWWGRRRSCSR